MYRLWGCCCGNGDMRHVGIVDGGQGKGSRRHCMPPITLASGSVVAGVDEGISSLRDSSFRFPGRGVSCHRAQRARDEGVGLAIESS